MAAFYGFPTRANGSPGEFELIARLTRDLATRPDVVLGVGDDAALLDLGAGPLLVATCDAQVAGRHFVLSIATPEEVGQKAFAVNLSDVAAMGAEPLWALVSLLLPPSADVNLLDGVYAGMRAIARRFDVAIVGGNVAATDGPLTIDVTLLGRVERGRAATRSGGRPGDLVLVTGEVGAAAAGVLALITDPRPGALPADLLERLRRAVAVPEPRVAAGRALAAAGVSTAMLDVSDGIAGDLRHLCERSGVGAILDADTIPISADVVAACRIYGRDPLELALGGGEDYELLFAVGPDRCDEALATAREAGVEAHVIGALTDAAGEVRLRRQDGTLEPLERGGWDHLRALSSAQGGG